MQARLESPTSVEAASQASESGSSIVFNTKQSIPREKYNNRSLDAKNGFFDKNYNQVATLFNQELLFLEARAPKSLLINKFKITNNGKQIVCPTRQETLPFSQPNENKESHNEKNAREIEKLLNDIFIDVEFLLRQHDATKVMNLLKPENISMIKGKNSLCLGNWVGLCENNETQNSSFTTYDNTEESFQKQRNFQRFEKEIKSIITAISKSKNISYSELSTVLSALSGDKNYFLALKSALSGASNSHHELQNPVDEISDPSPSKSLQDLQEGKKLNRNIQNDSLESK